MMTFDEFYKDKHKLYDWGDHGELIADVIKRICDTIPEYLEYVICIKLGSGHKR